MGEENLQECSATGGARETGDGGNAPAGCGRLLGGGQSTVLPRWPAGPRGLWDSTWSIKSSVQPVDFKKGTRHHWERSDLGVK